MGVRVKKRRINNRKSTMTNIHQKEDNTYVDKENRLQHESEGEKVEKEKNTIKKLLSVGEKITGFQAFFIMVASLIFGGLISYDLYFDNIVELESSIGIGVLAFLINVIILIFIIGIDSFFDKDADNKYYEAESKGKVNDIIKASESNKKIGRDVISLVDQYEIAINSEQFYERTMWSIGSILMTASISSIPISVVASGSISTLVVLFSLITYTAFLLIAYRLRASIRLFRNAALVLEEKIYGIPLRFVYDFEINGIGNPMKIWTVLIVLFFYIIDLAVYVTFVY